MDIESNSSRSRGQSDESRPSLNLFALIDHDHHLTPFTPYRSHLELQSIDSEKSRQSRDSDLLNRLAKDSSKNSSKSLSRNVSEKRLAQEATPVNPDVGSSNSNSGTSQNHSNHGATQKIEAHMMAPKIHNCVCFAAGECLNYNCNCFLSPFPCAPECCPNCLTLKTNLPHKVTNMCSCKKTRCLKLYCECLSKGIYCGVMCRCQLCENHEYSKYQVREVPPNAGKGCACQKSHCLKGYCDCYSQGLKCTPRCGCIDCHNMIRVEEGPEEKEKYEEMEVEGEMQFEDIDFFGSRKK